MKKMRKRSVKQFFNIHKVKKYKKGFKVLPDGSMEHYTPHRKSKEFHPDYEDIVKDYEKYQHREPYGGYVKCHYNLKAAIRKSPEYEVLSDANKRLVFRERSPDEIEKLRKEKRLKKPNIEPSPASMMNETYSPGFSNCADRIAESPMDVEFAQNIQSNTASAYVSGNDIFSPGLLLEPGTDHSSPASAYMSGNDLLLLGLLLDPGTNPSSPTSVYVSSNDRFSPGLLLVTGTNHLSPASSGYMSGNDPFSPGLLLEPEINHSSPASSEYMSGNDPFLLVPQYPSSALSKGLEEATESSESYAMANEKLSEDSELALPTFEKYVQMMAESEASPSSLNIKSYFQLEDIFNADEIPIDNSGDHNCGTSMGYSSPCLMDNLPGTLDEMQGLETESQTAGLFEEPYGNVLVSVQPSTDRLNKTS